MKLFPVSLVSYQGVQDFPGGGRLIFFLESVQFILERYILKLAFPHDKALPCILPRRTKLQFKIIIEEDPVPIASAQQYHIYIIQIFIYIFLRESSWKMGSKTLQIAQLTRNLGSMLQYP